AARAKAAAAEATRAANATVAIANQAAAAAGDAQRAANDAAAHAEAPPPPAEQAAQHAGDANTAANVAQAAATAADADATQAAQSAQQAHTVADVARASDAERLAAQQAAEMATADEASREADQKAKTAAWESGKATRFAADTDQLIADATAAGVDPKTAVLKGRQAAFRLLDAGGPWVKAAAQSALEGDDYAVQAFLGTDLAVARDRDDRTSVMTVVQSSGKMELRLAAEAASVGTPDQVKAFLATGQYPGKDDDDRVALSQIMAAGGPGVKAAAGKALDGTIDDVRAFLATGQYKARDDDNRVLVTQALASGGPEVKAAAQAVLSGPADRLVPFLQTDLPKAQQRDAMTATHVATIASYLATMDGSVAQARQYAAQAAQAYATARGAANEAAGYANQAGQSAQQAQGFANQAAQSAQAAQASAQQAAGYAKQAQAAAASANAAARSASVSAAAATSYAAQASKYATDAKNAADQANASAVAAAKSRDEAYAAAREAAQLIMSKQQADAADGGQMQSETAAVDDDGRVSYVDVVPHGDLSQKAQSWDESRCFTVAWRNGDNWHRNPAGKDVCTVPAKINITGQVDYFLRTCPEPNISIAACHGKYSVWDTLLVDTKSINIVVDGTVELDEAYFQHNTCYGGESGGTGCLTSDMAVALVQDFWDCAKNPGLNAACGWAASNFIPFGTLGKAAKGIIAFRYALETGTDLAQAKIALQVSLDGIKDATAGKLLATADAITAYRLTLKDGVGTDAALEALRQDRNVERSLVDHLETERDIATYGRTCPTVPSASHNSFPAGTEVLMGDGTTRPIETIRVGDLVTAADPVTGAGGPRAVTNTIYTPDDLDFTELTVDPGNGTKGSVTATDHHPFWVESTRAWTDAAAVQVGDTLRTDTGATAQVASIRHWTGLQPAYNLTVADLHTYYVLAGTVPVLTHNLDCFGQIQNIAKKLPNWVKDAKTRGFILSTGADGSKTEAVDLVSGYNEDRDAINSYFVSLGVPDGLSVVADVEVKLAWKMRISGRKNLEIVINKPTGPCTGPFSCTAAVPHILPEGYTLTVWYKDEFGVLAKDPVPLVGKAAPPRANG
ncbi:polymorphic toxin-type HINT domain-containing protein, partial [Kitasatospora nipponensis]|uniref:polymorphic toxin-type HINT domain-containing protein n=1 Tax=Kitasatospora nipponensis TaxID=258049 RepID=UPI0031DCFFEE